MTPERWRQIEDICHAGLARQPEERAAFLAQACVGDDGLQREVESLLAQESSVEGFMSAPAMAVAGSGGPDHAIGTLVGRRLGSYLIRSLLGVGGMGEVYRAHDDTLGREVAIKVLPPAFTADPERRARLEREARMLATLNHPHIGAIYGVEDADGMRALVLELVEGETLAERIARTVGPGARSGALPVPDALAIAQQVADALDAAQSAADWSLDGTWIVAGGRDATGAGLFKIPVDGGAPVPFIRGQATNPVRSPSGNLILYVGPNVGGQAVLLGLRPDAARVELPEVLVRPGSYRFLPDGTGVVFLPKESRDFWLLDLATNKTHPLTHLSDKGTLRTFDITPDGKEIVFDRSRENSDTVLIDLPK